MMEWEVRGGKPNPQVQKVLPTGYKPQVLTVRIRRKYDDDGNTKVLNFHELEES